MRVSTIEIDAQPLALDDLRSLFDGEPLRISVSRRGMRTVRESRSVVDAVLSRGDTVYGVNTGFGKLARVRISPRELDELQVHLLRSHACGVGQKLDDALSRCVLFLSIRSLVQGYSGVSQALVEQMVSVFNAGIAPIVPSQGSVGASGDLAPLAHLALVLIGEGEARVGGRRMDGGAALKKAGLKPIVLKPKEGIALINGTQVTTAVGAQALLRAENLARHADLACAMTIEALKGTDRAFDPRIQEIRGQEGQKVVARNLRGLMKGSAIRRSHLECDRVQDPYSLRCAPQVHGTVRDSLVEARRVLTAEINAVTDNPLVFVDTREILSGGNFHAQPVAAAADRIAAVVTTLASISERRVENLVNPDLSGLPAFLAPKAGLCSGFMILQVVAASLVSECKSSCFPASVDSIPTSANKEDHVSMGPISARKALTIVDNAEKVVAIELLCAAQGLDLETRFKSSRPVDAVYRRIRGRIPHVSEDRSMSADIERMVDWIQSGELLEVARKAGFAIA